MSIDFKGSWSAQDVVEHIHSTAGKSLTRESADTHGLYVRATVGGVLDEYLAPSDVPALRMRPKVRSAPKAAKLALCKSVARTDVMQDLLVYKQKPWEVVVHTSKTIWIDSSVPVSSVTPLLAAHFGLEHSSIDRSTLALWSDGAWQAGASQAGLWQAHFCV